MATNFWMCINLISFGSVNPEDLMLEIGTFATILQKWHIMPHISECNGSILNKFSALINMSWDDLTFALRSPKGRCYSDQLIGPIADVAINQRSTTDWTIVKPFSEDYIAMI